MPVSSVRLTGGTGRPRTNETTRGGRMGGTQCPSTTTKQRTISLKSSDGAAFLETVLPPHLLPLHPHHQGSPPNQPEQSERNRKRNNKKTYKNAHKASTSKAKLNHLKKKIRGFSTMIIQVSVLLLLHFDSGNDVG